MKIYNVPLLMRTGEVVKVLAMGMEIITEDLEVIDHGPAASLFPGMDPMDLI